MVSDRAFIFHRYSLWGDLFLVPDSRSSYQGQIQILRSPFSKHGCYGDIYKCFTNTGCFSMDALCQQDLSFCNGKCILPTSRKFNQCAEGFLLQYLSTSLRWNCGHFGLDWKTYTPHTNTVLSCL